MPNGTREVDPFSSDPLPFMLENTEQEKLEHIDPWPKMFEIGRSCEFAQNRGNNGRAWSKDSSRRCDAGGGVAHRELIRRSTARFVDCEGW